MRDSNPTVAANAAIALGRTAGDRLADGDALVDRLVAIVRATQWPSNMRSAAAEALSCRDEPAVAQSLRELLKQYGQPLFEHKSTAYLADLHAELLRTLARHVEVADEPQYLEALGCPAVEVRAEAVRAWRATHRKTLPNAIVSLRNDKQPRIRAAVLEAAAAMHQPDLLNWLIEGTSDTDLQVRLAAIAGLGSCGIPEARATIDKLRNSTHELIRAATVAALVAIGDRAAVLQCISDRSWQVRCVVAESLARWPGNESTATAIGLLDDQNVEVAHCVLQATEDWPLEQAGVVLFAALDKDSFVTRHAAASELATRWDGVADFSAEAPALRRKESLERLRARFRREIGFATPAIAGAAPPSADRPAAALTADKAALVERLVGELSNDRTPESQRREAIANLRGLGPELLAGLEQLVFQRQMALPEAVYCEVLPVQGPVFTALERLTSADILQRRPAAQSLDDAAAQHILGRLASERLAALVTSESDSLVWCSVLSAVARDPGDAAIRIAYMGLSNSAPEVRRRACANLAAHPEPKHATVLLPALDDPSGSVVAAAVDALGRSGGLDDRQPLRRLLATPNETLRLEVAVALSRLHDPAGTAALERLAYSSDVTLRRQTAVQMGELGDSAFAGPLVHLLDDRLAVRNAALSALPRVAGRNVGHPDGEPPVGSDEEVHRWKSWFQRHPE
jgi:HEAT repeat protein